LKLNCTHQRTIYADDNIIGGSVHTIKRSVEALVVIELEVNADKTQYMAMSLDRDAGRSYSPKTCITLPPSHLKCSTGIQYRHLQNGGRQGHPT